MIILLFHLFVIKEKISHNMFNNYIDGLAPSLLLIKNHFMVISKPYKVVLRDNGELSLLGYLKDPINS